MGDERYIEFAQVKKAFDGTVVFADLSLSIRRGESISIIGGSGSGKSVMLRLLIGLLNADSGAICFDGEDVVLMNEEQRLGIRRRISIMFQGGALFDSLTVGENVAYPLREQLALSEDEIGVRVTEKLKLVGLEGIEAQLPSSLSGGMQKRVALARAIVSEPEVILFDEPTAGLDPINTRRVDDLIRSIQRSQHITTLVVTHDLPSAYRVSDRIAMLSERKILAVLPPSEFRRTPIAAIHEFVTAMDEDAGARKP